jgi:hypothetical protein
LLHLQEISSKRRAQRLCRAVNALGFRRRRTGRVFRSALVLQQKISLRIDHRYEAVPGYIGDHTMLACDYVVFAADARRHGNRLPDRGACGGSCDVTAIEGMVRRMRADPGTVGVPWNGCIIGEWTRAPTRISSCCGMCMSRH